MIHRCALLARARHRGIPRPSADHVPPVLVHHVERSRSLHENVVLLTVEKTTLPEMPPEARYQLTDLDDGFYKLIVHSATWRSRTSARAAPDHPDERVPLDFDGATYYIGHETIVAGNDGVISRVPEAIFAYLSRNAVHEERRYGMPAEQIVEIGTQIDL